MKKILSVVLMAAIMLSGCAGENTGITTTSEIATTVSETEPVTTTVATTTTTTTKEITTTTVAITSSITTTLSEKEKRKNEVIKLYEERKNKYIPKFTVDTEPNDEVIGVFRGKELRIRMEPSIDGDKYSFGLFNSYTYEWEKEYNTNAKIVTSIPNDDLKQLIEKPHEYLVEYIGDNTIYIYDPSAQPNEHWCYNFETDDFCAILHDYPVLVKNGTIFAISENYSGPYLNSYELATSDKKTVISIDVKYDYSNYYTLYDNAILCINEDDCNWTLFNYNGEEIFEIPDYEYDLKCTDYNEKNLLILANGKDSGKYICLYNNKGEFVSEPILLDEEQSNIDELLLFDDFYVVIRKGEYEYEYEYENTIATFYEFDGSYIAKHIY